MGADLEREFKALSSRLPFGLNFERHRPEAVELPLRTVRKGDKVRVLPERGSTKKGNQRLWRVLRTATTGNRRVADRRGGFAVTGLSLLDVVKMRLVTIAINHEVVCCLTKPGAGHLPLSGTKQRRASRFVGSG